MANNEDNHAAESVSMNGVSQLTPKKGKRKGRLDFNARGTRAQRWISQNKVLCVSLCINICFIISTVAYFASPQPNNNEQPCISSPPLCPDDSHMHRKRCYYFSEEEYNWTSSEKFCSSRNSSLAKIEIDEQDFVERNIQNYPFWVGLYKSIDQQWKWIDGENARKPAGDGGDCAYLHVFKKMEANSGRCSTPHRFICKSEIH
nr:PREDICTED: C-type lectin domain family 2 member B [Anolis carolinensis]|eukprot:XP_008118300.1 PREDICTED: C-type lectin domain family 2 member B [Anolis carolinensis]